MLEKLVAYFPGSPLPVALVPVVLAQHGDLAILHMETTAFTEKLRPLPLAPKPPRVGESVSVLAYPMGVTGMVAKSPAIVYERLSSHPDDADTAGELAALSLIRPSATFGHIGDVSGDKLIYDAPATAAALCSTCAAKWSESTPPTLTAFPEAPWASPPPTCLP